MSLCNKGVGSSLSFEEARGDHREQNMSNRHRLPEWLRVFPPNVGLSDNKCSLLQKARGERIRCSASKQRSTSEATPSRKFGYRRIGIFVFFCRRCRGRGTEGGGADEHAFNGNERHDATPNTSGAQLIIKQMREPLFPIAPTFWTCTLIQSMLSGPVLCFSGT